MTRTSYYVGIGLCVIGIVLGGFAAAPSLAELGFYREMSCAEWERDPVEGAIRLTDCVLSATDPFAAYEVAAEGERGPWVEVAPVEGRGTGFMLLYSLERGHPMRPLVARLLEDDRESSARVRAVERFHAQLGMEAQIEGVIERGDDGFSDDLLPWYFVRPVSSSPPIWRTLGLLLAAFGAALLGLLVMFQRRWLRREAELRGEGSAPIAF